MNQPDLSKEHAVELQEQLRDFLLEEMGHESPASIAAAMAYELTSLIASVADSEGAAEALMQDIVKNMRHQILTLGVGHPHP